MPRLIAVALLAGLIATLSSPTRADEDKSKPAPKIHTDAYGDPLPPAALMRVGSLRLVHGADLAFFAISLDNKVLYSIGTHFVRAWDMATGKERGSFAIPAEERTMAQAVSADARFLACALPTGYIAIRDIQTGKILDQISTEKKYCHDLIFGPDGKSIIWSAPENGIRITELTGQRKTREIKSKQRVSGLIAPLTGGILIGTEQERAIQWNLATGKRLREYGVPGHDRFGLSETSRGYFCLDREGKTLFASGQTGLVAYETDSVEEKYRIEDLRNAAPLALSPDGKTLATANGNGDFVLLAAATGKAIRTIEGATNGMLAFSHDGKTLAGVSSEGYIQLWDVETGKPKLQPSEKVASAVFAKSGVQVVTAAKGRIKHWSLAGKMERQLEHAPKALAQLSPCAQYALLNIEGGASQLIDTEKGQLREAFTGVSLDNSHAVFHPSGRQLAVIESNESNKLHLYSTLTGKRINTIQLGPDPLPTSTILFSPDGRTLFTSHMLDNRLQRWELTTAKSRKTFRFPDGMRLEGVNVSGLYDLILVQGGLIQRHHPVSRSNTDVVVSPDGATIAVPHGERISLCNIDNAKVVRRLEAGIVSLSVLAYSPNGKLLAAGGLDNTIYLWEVSSGKRLAKMEGHRGPINSLVFSPDGKLLLSRASDSTANLWSIEEAQRIPKSIEEAKRPARKIEMLWDELASDDAEAAEQAGRDLVGLPNAVDFLGKHLQPVAAVALSRLGKLIELLDNEDNAQRQAATQELIALNEQAREVVEVALKSNSAEVRKRAAAILERLDGPVRGTAARNGRAVEVLERIGSAQAKKLLTELTRGAASARLTKDAAEALQRLGD